MQAKELECEHCGKYLGKAYGTAIVEILCPNSSCKAENHFKVIDADRSNELTFKFPNAPRPPKKKEVEVS